MDYYNLNMFNPSKGNAPNDLVMLVAILLLIIIVVFILEYAWNAVMPSVFGLRRISFWQALLLIIVARILFAPCI